MSKHTPGPWVVTHSPYCKTVSGPQVWTDGGMLIAIAAGEAAFDDANARLIAAAPELLAACQSLLAMVRRAEREGHKVFNREGDEFMAAEKVIAKATGGGDV